MVLVSSRDVMDLLPVVVVDILPAVYSSSSEIRLLAIEPSASSPLHWVFDLRPSSGKCRNPREANSCLTAAAGM